MKATASKSALTKRITHEIVQYAVVRAYLYVCFGALLLYKGAVLRSEGIEYAPYGLAAVKALILGKFMLLGHALRVGDRFADRPLIYPILHKSFIFLALLVVLDILEEVVAGLLHGRSVSDTLFDITGDSGLQILATCVVFFLILLPYFAYREVGKALGERNLIRMMFVARSPDPGL